MLSPMQVCGAAGDSSEVNIHRETPPIVLIQCNHRNVRRPHSPKTHHAWTPRCARCWCLLRELAGDVPAPPEQPQRPRAAGGDARLGSRNRTRKRDQSRRTGRGFGAPGAVGSIGDFDLECAGAAHFRSESLKSSRPAIRRSRLHRAQMPLDRESSASQRADFP
jgi:hypothetical protein